jgi:hypothetical protein
MNWLKVLVQSGITAGLIGLIVLWLKARITWEIRRREQTSQIAELVSLWVVRGYDKTRDENLVRWEAQKKYWELALWLKAPVLRALNEAVKGGGAGPYKDAMILARKMIVGRKDDVKAGELVHWMPVEEPGQKTGT